MAHFASDRIIESSRSILHGPGSQRWSFHRGDDGCFVSPIMLEIEGVHSSSKVHRCLNKPGSGCRGCANTKDRVSLRVLFSASGYFSQQRNYRNGFSFLGLLARAGANDILNRLADFDKIDEFLAKYGDKVQLVQGVYHPNPQRNRDYRGYIEPFHGTYQMMEKGFENIGTPGLIEHKFMRGLVGDGKKELYPSCMDELIVMLRDLDFSENWTEIELWDGTKVICQTEHCVEPWQGIVCDDEEVTYKYLLRKIQEMLVLGRPMLLLPQSDEADVTGLSMRPAHIPLEENVCYAYSLLPVEDTNGMAFFRSSQEYKPYWEWTDLTLAVMLAHDEITVANEDCERMGDAFLRLLQVKISFEQKVFAAQEWQRRSQLRSSLPHDARHDDTIDRDALTTGHLMARKILSSKGK